MIADQEYPVRPAFSLLTKLLDDFIAKVPQASFKTPQAISFPEVNTYLQKYQDPRQADAIMKVQQELDETKIILVSLSAPKRCEHRLIRGRPASCSTRRLSRSCSVERRSTIWWTGRTSSLHRARCSIRQQRRCAMSSCSTPRMCSDPRLQQNSCCVVM